MVEKPFLHKYIFIFLLFFFNFIIYINGQENKPKGRINPGCALLQTKIYCYGGFTGYGLAGNGPYFKDSINDHITLDLQPLGNNLSHFNQSLIQWNHVSNTYNGNPLTNLGGAATVELKDNSYIMYGGSTITDGNSPNLTFPFLHYNPEINAWKTFPLLPSNTYSSRTKIVNLGNDSIWIWGGRLYSSKNLYSADFGIFNYKSESWANVFPDTGAIKADHTATLGSNGLIYIIGGYYKANATADSSLSQFSRMFSFDTRSLSWGSIDAKGKVPSDRGLHTTTATADGKYFLIYGGAVVITSGLLVSEDVYYVYDISNNFFTEVPLPKNELSNNRNNARYGHFATLYNSTYLILSFGYNDATVPAESLSVLNIVDPTKPVWATALSEPDIPKDNGGGGNGPDSKILIPAIVVPVVVVLLGAAIGLFFFIRHRKQQRKKAFVLEQEDPRKKNTNPLDFTDPSTEIATTVANSNSLGKQSIEITKPFMMEEYDYQTTTFKSNNSHVSNTSYQQQHQQNWSTGIDHTNIDSTKPFDAGQ